jgi:hypothetical protein
MKRSRFEKRLTFRATAPLIEALEDIASSEGRSVAELARVVLVDFATARVIERNSAEGLG